MAYQMNSRVTLAETKSAIGEEFRKWKKEPWSTTDVSDYDFPLRLKDGDEAASVRFALRGIADTMANAYAQLAAPTSARDPYEVLGVRPDAPIAIAEAAYRTLAKTTHGDVGGDDEEMKVLNDAIERVKSDRT